ELDRGVLAEDPAAVEAVGHLRPFDLDPCGLGGRLGGPVIFDLHDLPSPLKTLLHLRRGRSPREARRQEAGQQNSLYAVLHHPPPGREGLTSSPPRRATPQAPHRHIRWPAPPPRRTRPLPSRSSTARLSLSNLFRCRIPIATSRRLFRCSSIFSA